MMMRIFFYDSVRFFQIFGITKYYYLVHLVRYQVLIPGIVLCTISAQGVGVPLGVHTPFFHIFYQLV